MAFFRTERVHDEMTRAIRRSQRADFRVVHYSVQRDHVHLLVEASDGERLRSGVHGLALRLGRAVNRALRRRRGSVWADRYHRRDLETPREVRHALVYVLMNHRKHAASGVVRLPRGGAGGSSVVELAREGMTVDPFSSALWFDGWTARAGPLIDALRARSSRVQTESADTRPMRNVDDTSPVATARTWLATTGWRRHGCIDPAEAPRTV